MALISLEEAKNYLRVDGNDDDALIGSLLFPQDSCAPMWPGCPIRNGQR